jgi:hypothetical protein
MSGTVGMDGLKDHSRSGKRPGILDSISIEERIRMLYNVLLCILECYKENDHREKSCRLTATFNAHLETRRRETIGMTTFDTVTPHLIWWSSFFFSRVPQYLTIHSQKGA